MRFLKIVLPLYLGLVMAPKVYSAEPIILGGSRPAPLLLPASAAVSGERVPLVVFLHGYGSNAVANDRYLGISAQRDALGVAVLLPNGITNSKGWQFWNATPECCDFEHQGVDDSTYLASLIKEAAAVAPIDPDRVYLIGHSNGGFMSYRFACDHPELIRGLVSIAGAFYRTASACKNPGATAVLQIHGTADDVVPYGVNERFLGAIASVDFWVRQNQCRATEASMGVRSLVVGPGNHNDPEPLPTPVPSVLETDLWRGIGCVGGQAPKLWTINGAGHIPRFRPEWIAKALEQIR